MESFLDAVNRRDPGVREAARELDALTLARIRPLLGEVSTLVISPDDELLRVPFAALVDEEYRYLVERYSISYVTSGRDLVALEKTRGLPREKPLIVADPDFGLAENKGSSAIDRLTLPSLPGSQAEAWAVGELLGLTSERILVGSRATERAVREVRGPAVLHLATHGFLLPEPESAAADRLQRGLVRSGLALAGVGLFRDREPADDGFLSALELAELDLAGTEVAVLSACDTGRGEFMNGLGLFGLRRALAVAGARTQLTSLWSADDRTTIDLMRSWYAQLISGVPRGEAWRLTQLAALAGSDLPELGHPARGTESRAWKGNGTSTSHPYYWAAFVVSGATGPVSEMRARANARRRTEDALTRQDWAAMNATFDPRRCLYP